ncbi:DUF1852 family protein [Microbacterium laevaniformans]|uniref:DUF1852 family protein n=1 Tax=Microbacterium laevaniformans TaxID=36807 RepID=A0A4S2D945_9MICO|nr:MULTISPECIES: putative oxygenase MesX [Microbacterium]TGY38126.1 DUF1852 family protein [Microbacterium laevaniformans]
MANDIAFSITTTRFDEDYAPAAHSRVTTNFANLARGAGRRQNLRNALAMIDRRFNELAAGDDQGAERYRVELDIVTVQLQFDDTAEAERFPIIEVLDVGILDHRTGERHRGIVGNNFSSYLRDYDFSVVLPAATAAAGTFTVPEDFGILHGELFQRFLASDAYRQRFAGSPVICISVSTSRTYRRTGLVHPVLGTEYVQDAFSLTDDYFARMGLQVRYFMPRGSVAPLAFYFRGDLLNDFSDLQLIGTIATMETFQKIYRPEVYNALTPAGEVYRPTLDHVDFVRTEIDYDREERSQLAVTQGRYAEEYFVKPHLQTLEQWIAGVAEPVA